MPADPVARALARPDHVDDHSSRRRRRARRRLWLLVPLTVVGLLGAGAAVVVAVDPFGGPAGVPRTDGLVDITWDTPANAFTGSSALGAGLGGLPRGEIGTVWTPANVEAMRSAGFGSVSLRSRTDPAVQAWHWNARGTWSDAAGQQGYWTSATEVSGDPGATYGYHLPRRGNTVDQGDNVGYSRLADGDPDTFWKSNPYLDDAYTGEPDADHPQWIVAAFDRSVPVDQVRIDWGTPYATAFRVQYWTGADALAPADGAWADFPTGAQNGRGGTQTVRVAPRPVAVRFVRILLTAGSDTAPPGSGDVRDRLGYAVRELAIGYTDGGFVDHVAHDPSPAQTTMVTSSTDPWHRAVDVDPEFEQPSVDRVVTSGLAAGGPVMVTVPALYGTPEDAAALATYLRGRGGGVRRIQIGSAPDAQVVQPEDYAALYLQTAAAMRAADPALEFGGPGLRTALPDWFAWPDADGVRSWTGRFVAYVRGRDRMDDFDFFSFAWHPFEDVCADPAEPLARHPVLLADLMRRQTAAGLPGEVPKVVTGYSYSAAPGQPLVEMPGAIVNAETAAGMLALGGDTSYVSGLEPGDVTQGPVGRRCNSWGGQMLFQNGSGTEVRPLATYQVAHMLAKHWVQPGTGRHTVYTATTDLRTADGLPQVTAYAVRRPDGRLAVLALNKDPRRPVTVRLARTTGGTQQPVNGRLSLFQYSPLQWNWIAEPKGEGYADRMLPPHRSTVDEGQAVLLPPYSVTVVRTVAPLR